MDDAAIGAAGGGDRDPVEFVRGTVIEAFGVAAERVRRSCPTASPTSRRPTPTRSTPSVDAFELGDRSVSRVPGDHASPQGALRAGRDAGAPRRRRPCSCCSVAPAPPSRGACRRSHDSRLEDRVVRPGRVDRCRPRRPDRRRRRRSCSRASTRASARPLVEAMALGTPIVCSARPAVREVVGDAAVVVEDAGEPPGEAWAAAVDAPRSSAHELVAAGRVRAPAVHRSRVGRGPVGGVPPSGRRMSTTSGAMMGRP